MVVDGIARSRVGLAPGEVYALALVSWMRSHHRHSVIAFPQEHTESIQFALDRRVPLLGPDRFVHGVVRSWWNEFLFRHYDSGIFSFFQFGSFFS